MTAGKTGSLLLLCFAVYALAFAEGFAGMFGEGCLLFLDCFARIRPTFDDCRKMLDLRACVFPCLLEAVSWHDCCAGLPVSEIFLRKVRSRLFMKENVFAKVSNLAEFHVLCISCKIVRGEEKLNECFERRGYLWISCMLLVLCISLLSFASCGVRPFKKFMSLELVWRSQSLDHDMAQVSVHHIRLDLAMLIFLWLWWEECGLSMLCRSAFERTIMYVSCVLYQARALRM